MAWARRGSRASLRSLSDASRSSSRGWRAHPCRRPALHPNLAEIYRRKVEALHEALAEPQTRDEALGILRGLVERIEVHPIEGGFEIELIGEIARMVELSLDPNGTKKAALDERTACSVKVVAGARNRLYLLIFAAGLAKIR